MKNKTFEINTKTMSYMAMFMALQVVLELAFKVIPGQPQGGSITLSLVPILLAAYLLLNRTFSPPLNRKIIYPQYCINI